jgi:hypothetical protein
MHGNRKLVLPDAIPFQRSMSDTLNVIWIELPRQLL